MQIEPLQKQQDSAGVGLSLSSSFAEELTIDVTLVDHPQGPQFSSDLSASFLHPELCRGRGWMDGWMDG